MTTNNRNERNNRNGSIIMLVIAALTICSLVYLYNLSIEKQYETCIAIKKQENKDHLKCEEIKNDY